MRSYVVGFRRHYGGDGLNKMDNFFIYDEGR